MPLVQDQSLDLLTSYYIHHLRPYTKRKKNESYSNNCLTICRNAVIADLCLHLQTCGQIFEIANRILARIITVQIFYIQMEITRMYSRSTHFLSWELFQLAHPDFKKTRYFTTVYSYGPICWPVPYVRRISPVYPCDSTTFHNNPL